MTAKDLKGTVERFFRVPFDGVIRIEVIDTDEAIWIDGRETPPVVSVASPPAVDRGFCLWRLGMDDVTQVLEPARHRIESSMIGGRLKISGDMSVMARLVVGDE